MVRERDFLLRTGMVNSNVYAGIQPDDCVVWRRVPGGYQNFSLCNHTCVTEVNGKPTGGNYVCDASFVFASGAKGFAPRQAIVGWTRSVAAAHAIARDIFFEYHFNDYCDEFCVSSSWAEAIKLELTDPNKKVEVNRFGGSPEMLKECAGIIADCKQAGFIVNLTTPGRRLMIDAQFVKDLAADPPQILAMSFDDVGPDEIKRLAKMDLDAIKAEWKTISPHHGQRQKAYEGLYAAKLMLEMEVPIKLLFNVVIHPGNIRHLDNLLATLSECVPGCFANPYPAQSFNNEPPCWTVESLPALRAHVLHFIEGTLAGTPGITRRISYYNMLEAAYRKWFRKDPKRLLEFMSGIGAWDITLRPGAYRYAQIGKSTEVINRPFEELPLPGGHLGCFWNPILGLPKHVNGSIEELAETITMGMVKRGRELRRGRLEYVQTSNVMPRLAFDTVSTELGIPFELVVEYIRTRKEYCGF